LAIELQCDRCCRSVSFDRVEPGATLFCPVCKEPIQARPAKVTEIAPGQSDSEPWWVGGASVPASELTPINPKSDAFLVFAQPPPATNDWPTVVDGPALDSATVPHEALPSTEDDRQPICTPSPVPSVGPSRSVSAVSRRRGLSAAALLPGVIAFALVWFPVLVYVGLMLSALGLLFSGWMLGQALARGRRGVDFLLAAFVVNLQSLILAVFFLASWSGV
jgi:hypothetical protein